MRYVGAQLRFGRVGHQMSCIWQARAFVEMFGFHYCHTPFVDYGAAGWFSQAAAWNDFFALDRGEIATEIMLQSHPTLTHSFGPYVAIDFQRPFDTWQRLAYGVPDEYLLLFYDLAFLRASDLQSWSQQGLIRPDTLRRMVGWFQAKLRMSELYAQTDAFDFPPEHLSVAVYWRRPGHGENLPSGFHSDWAPIKAALDAVQARCPDRKLAVKIFTQSDPGPLDTPACDYELICCDDEYPLVYRAMKTLFEADVTITTRGGTSLIVGIYRAFRRPTIADPLWRVVGVANDNEAGKRLELPVSFI